MLGQPVRYDGRIITDPGRLKALDGLVEWVAVCPEVELGLSVPREPIRLEGDPDQPRLVTLQTRQDLTLKFYQWVAGRLAELVELDLCGFVLKSRSPSCALGGMEVFDAAGQAAQVRGTGVFAAALRARFPHLPLIDDEALASLAATEQFIDQLFGQKRG